MSGLYFDSNVYGFIDAAGEAEAVRDWLKAHGHQAYVSEELNLGEALRHPEDAGRVSRVKTLVTVSRGRLTGPPIDLLLAEEVLSEIRRKRPQWVVGDDGEESKRKFLEFRRRHGWAKLRKDPTYMPAGADVLLPVIHQTLGFNRTTQKGQRDLLRAGYRMTSGSNHPVLDAKLKALDPIRQHWAAKIITDLESDLRAPQTASAESDWLRPILDIDAIFRGGNADWALLWIDEADMDRMPLWRFYARLVQVQPEVSADIGNTFDALHAVYLFRYPFVLTTDRDLAAAVQRVQAEYPTPGRLQLLRRDATSALAEIERVLGESGR